MTSLDDNVNDVVIDSENLSYISISLITYNVRGIKNSFDYINQLLKFFSPNIILCVNEHWLHTYDLGIFDKLFPNFQSTAAECAHDSKGSAVPRLREGLLFCGILL